MRLAVLWALALSVISSPAIADDRLCDALPEPLPREKMPFLQNWLSAGSLLGMTRQCGLDASRHEAFLTRAMEGVECEPNSPMEATTAKFIRGGEDVHYRIAALFDAARQHSPEGVEEVCASLAEFNPDEIDVSSEEDAYAVGRVIQDANERLALISLGRSK